MAADKQPEQRKRGIFEEDSKGCERCVAAWPINVLKLAERLNGPGYHPAFYTRAECAGCGIGYYTYPGPEVIAVHYSDQDRTAAAA